MNESNRAYTMCQAEDPIGSDHTRSDQDSESQIYRQGENDSLEKEKLDFYSKVTHSHKIALEKLHSVEPKMGIQTSEYSSPEKAVKNFPSSLLDKHNSRCKNQNAQESQQNKFGLACQEIAKTITLSSINFLASKSDSESDCGDLILMKLMDFRVPVQKKLKSANFVKMRNLVLLHNLQSKRISKIEYIKNKYLNYFLTDSFLGSENDNIINFPDDILEETAHITYGSSLENRERLVNAIKTMKLNLEDINHQ
jgi:hypothetical protein